MLVQCQTLDQFRVVDRSANLLDDSDVPKIHVGRFWCHESGNGLYGDRGEDG